MNCEQARQYWNDRIDGKIIDEAAFDAHVAGCPACRSYRDEMERLTGLLVELGRDTESIVSRGAAAHPAEVAPLARWHARWRPIGAMAAVLAIAATLWIQVSSLRQSPPSGEGGARPTALMKSVVREPLGLTLRGESAERFMAVAQPTVQPNVQVFRLYETWKQPPSGEASQAGT